MKNKFKPGETVLLFDLPILDRLGLSAGVLYRRYRFQVLFFSFFSLCYLFSGTKRVESELLVYMDENGEVVSDSREENKYYVFSSFVPTDQNEKAEVAYIRRFYHVAKTEQEKFGQPASVALAQGIVESKAGRSKLAKKTNNHFGIKCFSRNCKKGHCSNHTDDSHKDFFKVYGNAWESWRDHSKHVSKATIYKKCHGKSAKGWCDCLKSVGYFTSKSGSEALKSRIEKYKLEQFDK